MLLGLLVRGVILAAALSAIVIVVSGFIDMETLEQEMLERGIDDSIITAVDHCNNTISFKELASGTEYQLKGDSIDYDIEEGDVIYVC